LKLVFESILARRSQQVLDRSRGGR